MSAIVNAFSPRIFTMSSSVCFGSFQRAWVVGDNHAVAPTPGERMSRNVDAVCVMDFGVAIYAA
jgi:hypothetical protein